MRKAQWFLSLQKLFFRKNQLIQHVDCKIEGQSLSLKSEFLKKA
ncbi:PhnA domain-containing protein [Helicobacter pylori]|nr:PhnA domain-containing protein [Helicobacter pylori]